MEVKEAVVVPYRSVERLKTITLQSVLGRDEKEAVITEDILKVVEPEVLIVSELCDNKLPPVRCLM